MSDDDGRERGSARFREDPIGTAIFQYCARDTLDVPEARVKNTFHFFLTRGSSGIVDHATR